MELQNGSLRNTNTFLLESNKYNNINIIDIPNLQAFIIGENCLMTTKQDFEICNYAHLEKIVIKKSSLRNINSLTISNDENLKMIEIENGYQDSNDNYILGPCFNVNTVTVSSIITTHIC